MLLVAYGGCLWSQWQIKLQRYPEQLVAQPLTRDRVLPAHLS
jgi:hypothetical protein